MQLVLVALGGFSTHPAEREISQPEFRDKGARLAGTAMIFRDAEMALP
jgi:hypothetical protein